MDLEEHYDREQYSSSMLEYAYSRKVQKPLLPASQGREVHIQLRSNEWRKGVRKSSREYIEKAKALLEANFNQSKQLQMNF